MSGNKTEGLGDDQGTRVGAPDKSSVTPAKHSDAPTGRPERSTGAGSEATQSTKGSADAQGVEHRSGYGGAGGEPVKPSDTRK